MKFHNYMPCHAYLLVDIPMRNWQRIIFSVNTNIQAGENNVNYDISYYTLILNLIFLLRHMCQHVRFVCLLHLTNCGHITTDSNTKVAIGLMCSLTNRFVLHWVLITFHKRIVTTKQYVMSKCVTLHMTELWKSLVKH